MVLELLTGEDNSVDVELVRGTGEMNGWVGCLNGQHNGKWWKINLRYQYRGKKVENKVGEIRGNGGAGRDIKII